MIVRKKMLLLLSLVIMQAQPLSCSSHRKRTEHWKKVALGALALTGLFCLGTLIKNEQYYGDDISPFQDFADGIRFKNFFNSRSASSTLQSYSGFLILSLFRPQSLIDGIIYCFAFYPHDTAYPLCYKTGNLTTVGIIWTLIRTYLAYQTKETEPEMDVVHENSDYEKAPFNFLSFT